MDLINFIFGRSVGSQFKSYFITTYLNNLDRVCLLISLGLFKDPTPNARSIMVNLCVKYGYVALYKHFRQDLNYRMTRADCLITAIEYNRFNFYTIVQLDVPKEVESFQYDRVFIVKQLQICARHADINFYEHIINNCGTPKLDRCDQQSIIRSSIESKRLDVFYAIRNRIGDYILGFDEIATACAAGNTDIIDAITLITKLSLLHIHVVALIANDHVHALPWLERKYPQLYKEVIPLKPRMIKGPKMLKFYFEHGGQIGAAGWLIDLVETGRILDLDIIRLLFDKYSYIPTNGLFISAYEQDRSDIIRWGTLNKCISLRAQIFPKKRYLL